MPTCRYAPREDLIWVYVVLGGIGLQVCHQCFDVLELRGVVCFVGEVVIRRDYTKTSLGKKFGFGQVFAEHPPASAVKVDDAWQGLARVWALQVKKVGSSGVVAVGKVGDGLHGLVF